MDFPGDDKETVLVLYRDPLFERCLDELRKQGGYAAVAAKKADEFISTVTGDAGRKTREKFRFTRNGEYRIKHCRKVDLGCGYRLVCIHKDRHLVLLYAGTHDDCFRWIERNKGMQYEIGAATRAIRVSRERTPQDDAVQGDALAEERFSEAYEAELMSRIDDTVLRRVFSGLVNR